jgi:dTMP kinase
MAKSGIFIAFEGIDGSGKQTQVRLLEHELVSRGYPVYRTGFPQYESWFGKLVGHFLNGDYGSLDQLDPHVTALLYAGDRFEAKQTLTDALNQGKIVLADRYVGSNLAHQTVRAPAGDRAEFIRWIEHLEYNIYGLPKEDLVLYLRVPPHEAQNLVNKKSARVYTESKQDILEASLSHLQDAADMYDSLSRGSPWATIQCYDALRRSIRLPEEISADVLTAVEPLLTAVART